jgi:hypothetical protein
VFTFRQLGLVSRTLALLTVRGVLMWLYVPVAAVVGTAAFVARLVTQRATGPGARGYVRAADALVTRALGVLIGLRDVSPNGPPRQEDDGDAVRLSDAV